MANNDLYNIKGQQTIYVYLWWMRRLYVNDTCVISQLVVSKRFYRNNETPFFNFENKLINKFDTFRN